MNYSYYYNQVPGELPWRNNLIYTSLISDDKKTITLSQATTAAIAANDLRTITFGVTADDSVQIIRDDFDHTMEHLVIE